MIDWRKYPNFTKQEFDCSHTGENEMSAGFMQRLQFLREEYGTPMRITSGYRSPKHPIESAKEQPGSHASGHACDIAVSRADAHRLLGLAIKHGFTGIGVQQKGSTRFIHLDDLPNSPQFPRPTIWSY